MWPYRDWVIDALNRDMPFDEFTIEQIAGDMLPERDRRAADRHRIPPQHAAQPGRRDRRRGGAVGDAGRSREHDGHRVARLDDRPARSATTTSTTRSRSATTTGMLAFFDNGDYSVFGEQGGDTTLRNPMLDLPTPEQAAQRNALQARAR